MKDVKWETIELKHDRAKELKAENFKEPTPEDTFFLIAFRNFGGCCSIEELWQIAKIVANAYKRMEENAIIETNKNCKTVKISKIMKTEVQDYHGPKKSRRRTRYTK